MYVILRKTNSQKSKMRFWFITKAMLTICYNIHNFSPLHLLKYAANNALVISNALVIFLRPDAQRNKMRNCFHSSNPHSNSINSQYVFFQVCKYPVLLVYYAHFSHNNITNWQTSGRNLPESGMYGSILLLWFSAHPAWMKMSGINKCIDIVFRNNTCDLTKVPLTYANWGGGGGKSRVVTVKISRFHYLKGF